MVKSNREKEIFEAALDIPALGERAAYLEQACGGDEALLARVQALLEASATATDFLADVPREVAATGAAVITEGPGTVIGRYKLLQQIGEGGMGVVWMAEQTEPVRRRVALKIIKLGMDTKQVVARFEAERQALALMDHPNIARVLDAGATETGRPYFVMELVRGIPITRYCDENRLDTPQRLALFTEVCSAVQHAHQKGIIHRDLKPSNILVTSNDGVPLPKVIDFGIAKATADIRLTDQTLFTRFEMFLGTPAYMSPEQAGFNASDIDTRTDIYALGVLLYELLTGKTPFDGKELMSQGIDAMRRTIREQEPPRPSTRVVTFGADELTTTARCRSADTLKLLQQLKGDLDWIVMKCLEKSRTRRYETANALRTDITRYLTNEPIVARPPSTAYKLQKAWRRHRVVFTAGALTLATLVSGIVVSTWQARDAMAARDRERGAKERLREQVAATQEARRRAEGLLAVVQIQRAEELLGTPQSTLGISYLGQLLRANSSNEVAAARLVSVLRRPFCQPLTESLRHEAPVWSAQFSPDGQRVVTGSEDQTARVWDACTGQPLTKPLRHDGIVSSVQFSPDGQRVVTGSEDQTARVWDACTGQPLTKPLRHDGIVSSVQFSPDSQRVVTASDDKTARVWGALTGSLLADSLQHEAAIRCARFSADGRWVVTGSDDNTARVWDARTGEPLTEPLWHKDSVRFTEFSPDGQLVVTASSDHTARVWDVRTGDPIGDSLRHEDLVTYARFSPDGQWVVTASGDNTARVWDALTGEPLTKPLRHEARVTFAEFSQDGQRVVTAALDSIARVWDARTGEPVTEPLRHEARVNSAHFSPDCQRVVTASSDNSAQVWGVQRGESSRIAMSHGARVNSARFSSDSQRVVTASGDNTACLWDALTGALLTEPLRHEAEVTSAEFSPDGRHVATASSDWTARLWSALTGTRLTEPLRHEAEVTSAEFSPDGKHVVTASSDWTARLWSALTGQPLTDPLRHEGRLWSAKFSPDGERVVTASEDRTARVWDAVAGQPVAKPLRHDA